MWRRFGVDRLRALAYIAAFLVAGALAAPAHSAEYQTYLGATLPKWARKIGEHRFQSPWDWHTTIRWLNKTYASRAEYPRIRIVNQPGVKAIHLKNARKRGGWEGMNIYQLQDGRVRFYVLPRRRSKEAQPKKEAKKQAKAQGIRSPKRSAGCVADPPGGILPDGIRLERCCWGIV